MVNNDPFDLFDRRLYNVSEVLQLHQGILGNSLQEGVVRQFNIDSACGTYPAVECWEVNVGDCRDKRVASETKRGIVNNNDEMRAALAGGHL
jgi:hypothetical protein